MQLDFLDHAAPDKLKAMLGGPADVVLSDMAANATGHRKTDHLRIMALAEAAADFAGEVLAPGGAFLCKVLQGGTEAALLAKLKRDFTSVKHVKPAASRADSAELYLLATGYRGGGATMTKKRMVLEIGMGTDIRGADPTKAACRALRDALWHNSLSIAPALGHSLDAMIVDIHIGVPAPNWWTRHK